MKATTALLALVLGQSVFAANAQTPTQTEIIEKTIRKALDIPTDELTNEDWKKVTNLHLSNNQLSGVGGLENLTQLTHLDLHSNQLTDVMGLENFTQLKQLKLNNNQLSNVNALGKLTQLRALYLGDNPDLTKAQIAVLQVTLPECNIYF